MIIAGKESLGYNRWDGTPDWDLGIDRVQIFPLRYKELGTLKTGNTRGEVISPGNPDRGGKGNYPGPPMWPLGKTGGQQRVGAQKGGPGTKYGGG